MTAAAEILNVAKRIKRSQPYVGVRVSDDRSRIIALRESLTGCEIIAGCDEFGCNEVYSYDSMLAGAFAFTHWSGDRDSEPEKWVRHMPSCRRRPGGDPELEHVSP